MDKSLKELKEFKKDPAAVLSVRARYDLDVLLTVPLKRVRASADVLNTLLFDLEQLFEGVPFYPDTVPHEDAGEFRFIFSSDAAHVAALDQIPTVIDCSLDGMPGVRAQIEAVLDGRQDRVQLSEGYPLVKCPEIQNLEDARRHLSVSVIVRHTGAVGHPLMMIECHKIHCTEAVFRAMLEDIDRVVPGRPSEAAINQPRYTLGFFVKPYGPRHRWDTYFWLDDEHLSNHLCNIHRQIEAVLAGKKERIEMPPVAWWS